MNKALQFLLQGFIHLPAIYDLQAAIRAYGAIFKESFFHPLFPVFGNSFPVGMVFES